MITSLESQINVAKKKLPLINANSNKERVKIFNDLVNCQSISIVFTFDFDAKTS